MKNAYPNTKFIIFTDPIPKKHFKLTINNEHHRGAYERWFHDMIDVFGEVYSFQGYTPININTKHFSDLFHYYPKVGDRMVNAIEKPNKHEEILTIVNDNNIEDYLSQLSNR